MNQVKKLTRGYIKGRIECAGTKVVRKRTWVEIEESKKKGLLVEITKRGIISWFMTQPQKAIWWVSVDCSKKHHDCSEVTVAGYVIPYKTILANGLLALLKEHCLKGRSK